MAISLGVTVGLFIELRDIISVHLTFRVVKTSFVVGVAGVAVAVVAFVAVVVGFVGVVVRQIILAATVTGPASGSTVFELAMVDLRQRRNRGLRVKRGKIIHIEEQDIPLK